MLSRNPTRLELKAEDLAELNQAQQRRAQQPTTKPPTAMQSQPTDSNASLHPSSSSSSSSSSARPSGFLDSAAPARSAQERIGYVHP